MGYRVGMHIVLYVCKCFEPTRANSFLMINFCLKNFNRDESME